MASSAQDIPSTTYKPQNPSAGLDPVTVIRVATSDSQSAPASDSSAPAPRASTLARLFPTEDRVHQADLPAGLKLGDYVVEARIGAGGMGAVFKARDERLDRAVALKILSPSQASDPASVKRFQNEARAAARLDHDNIARIYAVGEAHGLHYIAFEYVEGITIRELIRQRGVVPPHEAINYILQISVALKHTAAAGVVHRDIKPSNLIITPQGRAKLVDWGLARKERLDDQSLDLTVSGTTLGTFDYISPEQARDPRNVDVRSDIYSLGCTAYHMLTGSPPYAEGTVLQKLLDHQGKAAPDPRDRNPNVPRELSRIVRKMMASSPDDRYWSPQSLTHDLLMLASETGLRAIHPDGLTWQSQQDATATNVPRGIFWWWLGAFAAACLLAILADRWMVARDETFKPQIEMLQAEQALKGEDDELLTSPPPERISNKDVSAGTLFTPPSPDVFPLVGEQSGLFSSGPDNRKPALIVPDDLPAPLTGNFPAENPLGGKTPPWADSGLLVGWDDSHFPEREPGVMAADIPADILKKVATSVTASPMPMGETEGNSPMPLVNTRSPYRILAVNGDFIQASPDLESALSVVPDGGVIEYQAEAGKTSLVQARQLRIDKSVTIRSASNSQLILRFDTSLVGNEVRTGEFITIKGGALTLSNVHLQVVIPKPLSQPWSLFAFEGAGRLRCRQSTVTIDSQFQTSASIVKLNRSALQTVDSMDADDQEMEILRRIQIDDCVIRGAADLVFSEASDASSLEITRSLITIEGALLRYSGDNNNRMEPEAFEVRLSRVAGVVNQGVLKVDLGMTIPRQPVELFVRSEDSILIGQKDQPLIECVAGMENLTLQNLLHWDGEHNLFGGWENFVSLRGLSNLNASPTVMNYDAWIQNSGLIREVSPRLLKNTTPPGEINARFDQWTARKFQSILLAESPENILSADLTDYGPDFFDLPVPPPLFDTPPTAPAP